MQLEPCKGLGQCRRKSFVLVAAHSAAQVKLPRDMVNESCCYLHPGCYCQSCWVKQHSTVHRVELGEIQRLVVSREHANLPIGELRPSTANTVELRWHVGPRATATVPDLQAQSSKGSVMSLKHCCTKQSAAPDLMRIVQFCVIPKCSD